MKRNPEGVGTPPRRREDRRLRPADPGERCGPVSVEVAVQNTYCVWKAHEVDNDYVKDLHGTDMVSAFQDGDSDLDSEADFEARRCDQVEEKAKEYLRENHLQASRHPREGHQCGARYSWTMGPGATQFSTNDIVKCRFWVVSWTSFTLQKDVATLKRDYKQGSRGSANGTGREFVLVLVKPSKDTIDLEGGVDTSGGPAQR